MRVGFRTIIVLASLALPGCFLLGPPDSVSTDGNIPAAETPTDADIVSFSLGELPIEVSLDAATRTVVAVTPPVDLALIEPTIEVSAGASIVNTGAFADGLPTTITLSPSIGQPVEWTVTVHVKPGMTFLLDGERVTLLAGCIDSTRPDLWANGIPAGSFLTRNGQFEVWGHETITEADSCKVADGHGVLITLPGLTTGTYSTDTDNLYLSFWNETISPTVSLRGETITVLVTSSPGQVGEFMTGRFDGVLSPAKKHSGKTPPPTPELTEGFFKVLRVGDDIWGEHY